MATPDPLDPKLLYRACVASLFDFATTAELPDLTDAFVQPRAADALRFGIDIARRGFNVFVLGEPGSGRHYMVRRLLEDKAATRPAPGDWCYVVNFVDAHSPRALHLPPGRGRQFQRDMQQFVAELGKAIPAAFESEEHRSRIEAIQEETKQREESALRELGQAAAEQGIALLRTPRGFVFAPMKGDEAMRPEQFAELPEAERERIARATEELHQRLHGILHQFPRWRREMQNRIQEASRETLALAAGHLIEDLKQRYADLAAVLAFLDQVMQDVVDSGEALREQQKSEGETVTVTLEGNISLDRYRVNLLVDHAETAAAPVVYEDHPSYQNLVGRVDHLAHLGTLVTNFMLIKPGALHKANGGYLVLDALRLVTQPYAWEGLKRVLKAGEIRIESLGQVLGFASAPPLEPEPIPVEIKVVLVGERLLYYLLSQYDPEFQELFKVAADFEDEVRRNDEGTRAHAQLIGMLARHHGLRPLDGGAVARLIEHSARIAGDAEKLSTCTRKLSDLLHEADYWAGRAGREVVSREDVERTIAAQIQRCDRLRRELQELVLRDTVLIATSGAHTGQVNGLAVIDLGDFAFAQPVRITATARLGEGDVIDIEREAELGGAIHTKGVMILTSFLAARYASAMPLSLTASIVFEQSYGPVEGDSASLAELCALLSALADAPIRQSLAVTGSVNQYGRVQAIGGVNEKIEGFFDLCQARGLTGEQGVLIPESNVKHLMLRADVVAAAREGRFRIHAVEDVDQAIEVLTGVAAGQPDATGLVPPGSMNYLVAAKLAEMSLIRQAFGNAGRKSRAKRSETAAPASPRAIRRPRA